MEIIEVKKRGSLNENIKLNSLYVQFEKLIIELRTKELPDTIVDFINMNIEELNLFLGSEKKLKRLLKEIQSKIINHLEKEIKIVPKNYYQNMWTALGLAIFGTPLGVFFGIIFDNFAFLGIGFPFGMVIGIAIGAGKDKKALDGGKQLDFEMKLQ